MEKKGLIVYYSWIGNTDIAAREIQRLTGFDLLRIEEVRDRKYGSVMGAALSAILGLQSQIKPMDFTLRDYDAVFLGTPVWAGKTAPAVNRFLRKADLKGKEVRAFVTKGDDQVPQKVFDSLARRIEKRGGKVREMLSLTTVWDPKTNVPVSVEEIESGVKDWIEKTLNFAKGDAYDRT